MSAGRVQSVAVRLIVERERDIHAFVSEASYKVTAVFTDDKGSEIKADLGKRFKTKEEAKAFLESCKNAGFKIEDITTRPMKNRRQLRLQLQLCSRKLRVSWAIR